MKKRRGRVIDTTNDCIGLTSEQSFDSVKKSEYFLSELDRITVIVGLQKQKVDCVINVSYEIYVRKKWITILRFDSAHGYLHRHTRISLDNPDTTVESFSVIQRGVPKDWLTWAMKYMNRNFYDCKVGFCRRSKIAIIDLS